MPYTPTNPQDVWDAADMLARDGARLPAPILAKLAAAVRDHRIEVLMRPSRRPCREPTVVARPDGSESEEWFRGASPKQLAFQKAFLDRIGRERTSPTFYAIAGGNRAAKSVCAWGLCFAKFIRDHANNGDVFWAVAPTFPKLKQGPHKWLWEYLPRYMFSKDRPYTEEQGFGVNPVLELTLAEGRGKCTVVFHTEDQDIQQLEADKVRLIAWTEARRESFMVALRMRIIDLRGAVLIDYLPCEGWHQERLMDNPMVHHAVFSMWDNAHNLPPGEIAKVQAENAHDPDMLALRIEGKPRAMMGVVISTFDRGKHVIEPFNIPDWWPLYMAGDWGFDHPHAFVLATVAPNGVIYLIDEQYANRMNVAQVVLALWNMVGRYRPLDCGPCPDPVAMFAQMRRALDTDRLDKQEDFEQWFEEPENPLVDHCRAQWERVLARPCAIDSQVFQHRGDNAGMTLGSQFIEIGFPVVRAVKGEIEWSVETLRRRFHDDRMFVFNRCVHIRRDLSSWKYRQDEQGHPKGGRDRHGEQFKDGCLDGATEVCVKGLGWVQIADVENGEVLTPNGYCAFTRSDNGYKDTIRVEFDDGSFVIGTPDHLVLQGSPMRWSTLLSLAIGDKVHGPGNHFRYSPEVQRCGLLAVPAMAVLHARCAGLQGRMPFAPRSLGVSQRANTENAPHSPQKRGPGGQFDWEPGGEADIGTFVRPHDPGSEGAVAHQYAGKSHSRREGMAQNRSRAAMAFATRESSVERGFVSHVHMRNVREGISGAGRHKGSILPSQLQNAKVSPREPGEVSSLPARLVEEKTVIGTYRSGVRRVYDLTVPDARCFVLRCGVVVHNCDAVRYLVQMNPTHERSASEELSAA